METTNVKGLEKQTKKQLIDIILRKDDVEHRQEDKIKILQKDLESAVKSYNQLNDKYKKLDAEYKVETDSSTYIIKENNDLKKKIKIKNDIIVAETVIFVICLIGILFL